MATPSTTPRARIVLVEDDEFLSSMYETKLTKTGYESHIAHDGQEGWDLILAEKPDLVLLDILLPKMSGFEVLEKMKADPELKKIPVILLTNLSQRNDVEKGLELGANDYLIKAHFTPNEVVMKIQKLIGK